MFISKKVPRCSEGSVHPQTHWLQPGLQRRSFFSEIYENFSSWSKVFQWPAATGHIIPTQNCPKPSLLPGRALGPFLIPIAVSFHQVHARACVPSHRTCPSCQILISQESWMEKGSRGCVSQLCCGVLCQFWFEVSLWDFRWFFSSSVSSAPAPVERLSQHWFLSLPWSVFSVFFVIFN